MRYFNVATVEFDDVDIKANRDFEDLEINFNYSLQGEKSLEEVAYRVWGPGYEMQVYKIYDLNKDRIAGYRGDFSAINELRIPVI